MHMLVWGVLILLALAPARAGIQYDSTNQSWKLASGPVEYRLHQESRGVYLEYFGPSGGKSWKPLNGVSPQKPSRDFYDVAGLAEGQTLLPENLELVIRFDSGGPLVLPPGDTFQAPLVAFTTAAGDLDEAANQMHRYQRQFVIPHTPANDPLLVQSNSWLDDVRAAHPQLVIENCSSGGLRFDLGIIGHAHTNWLSDKVSPLPSVQLAYGSTIEFAPEICNHCRASVIELEAGPQTITLDGRQEGRTFEGIGALSAGASSRLLIDYPEPSRSQILDYLFQPNFGAGFQHLKVEIGGDVNSTDGCEPSHMHQRHDENYSRGYEWWLMKEAKARNPGVLLDGLEWGAPAWIGNGHFYSQDNADYIVKFLKGAKSVHGLAIDYVGIWNETRYDTGWIKLFRQTLDRNGLEAVKIIAAEEINQWSLVDVMRTDPELAAAVHAVGVHYPKFKSTGAAQRCGKPIWSSEDGPWKGNWAGAAALAKAYNRNYIDGQMTKTVIWSPVTAYYDNLPIPGSGVMKANTPWSGYYEVQPALWATAHTTQFAAPGWKYLESGACGYLANGGSCVTLKSTNASDYSIIVETVDATAKQEVGFKLESGLSTAPLHVWRSTAAEQFVRLHDVSPSNGTFSATFEPGSIYSLTTTAGQTKGSTEAPRPSPFPTAYADNFESYRLGSTPRFLSDQAGIFEVVKRPDGQGQCLRQVIDRKGIEWPLHLNPFPETFLGDANWRDYEVSVDVLIEKEGSVSLFGRVGAIPQKADLPSGYWLKFDHHGYWELGTAKVPIASGKVPVSVDFWHNLRLKFAGTQIKVAIDQNTVTEVTNEAYPSGMVGIGSGWHGAQFDNLSIRGEPGDANLAFAAKASASSCLDADLAAACAVDGDGFSSRWSAAKDKTAGEWLEVDFGSSIPCDAAVIKQFEDRITGYKIQYWNGTEWLEANSGGAFGNVPRTIRFPEVTTRKVRLFITAAKASPSIWEFEVRDLGPGG
ncbi:MAG: discoidin domain-containing protein [Verrucomicrobia bacterium]|nr:discoidin domain-containing protein [Verrucomicrobiota bacterium]